MSDAVMFWTGWGLTGIFSAFLLLASVAPKLARHASAVDPMGKFGWDPELVVAIGIIEGVCVLLCLIPPTAVVGLILLTGLLGGAIATQWRIKQPMFSHVLFGVYVGVAMWGGLWLRSPDLRSIIPLQLG